MTDTKSISKNTIAQQFSITDDSSPLLKHLKSDTLLNVKNVTSTGSLLQLEIQLNGKWEKVTLALDSANKNKEIQINDGKLIIHNDGLKITLIANNDTKTSALNTQDILKILHLFVQPKAQKETYIGNILTSKDNQEVSLLAQLNKNLKNTLSIPALKANIQLPSNITHQLNLNTHVLLNLQESNKEIIAKIYLPKSNAPAFELKVPIEKVIQWFKSTQVDLKIKSSNTANSQIKQNNNITTVSANISPKLSNWQNAKIINQGSNIKIESIFVPVDLNLTTSIYKSLLKQNSSNSMTDTILKIHSKNTEHNLAVLKGHEHIKTHSVVAKNENIETPFSKVVNSIKAAFTTNSELVNQIKTSVQHSNLRNKNIDSVTPNKEPNIETTNKSLTNQLKTNFLPNSSQSESIKVNPTMNEELRKTQLNIPPQQSNKQVNSNLSKPLRQTIESNKTQELDAKKFSLSTQNTKSDNVFTVKNDPQTPELNKLVNQAFSKMITPKNISTDKVRSEILSTVQPNLLNQTEQSNTFSNSIQELALSLLASHSINQKIEDNISSINKYTQKLDQLLQLIFPGLKTKTRNIIKEARTKAGSALIQELGQMQHTVKHSQQQLIQNHVTNTQADNLSNTILQFLLPMQLPETVKQTEINLGRYKKNKEDGELKDVWFIRLNFNFETLGQLQVNAQLMDKNVECTFLGTKQKLIEKAEPYINMLKQRLIEHGLSVGKMTIEQGRHHSNESYNEHSIINIKV